jgi:hypothetical protein
MVDFYSIENLKMIVNIFKEYMLDKFKIHIEGDDEMHMRQYIFNLMKLVPDEHKNKTGNIQVLNAAKGYYLNIHRGKTQSRAPVSEAYEKIVSDREIVKPKIPQKIIKPATEVAENTEDFLKKVKEFEFQRNAILKEAPQQQPPIPQDTFIIQNTNYEYTINSPVVMTLEIVNLIIPVIDYIPSYITLCINNQTITFIHQHTFDNINRKYIVAKPINSNSKITLNNHTNVITIKNYKKTLPYHAKTILTKEDKFKITLDTFFEKCDFAIGDKIILQNKEYTITEFDDISNGFYVNIPGIFNRKTGEYDYENISFLKDSPTEIINLSLEHTIICKIISA